MKLRDVLAESLPLDADRRLEWAVWLNYWAAAATDETLAAQQRRHYQSWHQVLEGVLMALHEGGQLRSGLEAGAAADLLMATVDGLGLRATVDPDSWPPHRQLEQLDRQLLMIGLHAQ